MSESRIAIELAKLQNKFSGGENTEELFASARELLPFKDGEFKIVSVKGKVNCIKPENNCFEAKINCNLSSVQDIQDFQEVKRRKMD